VVEEIENVIDTSPVEKFFQTNGPSTNKWSAASAPCSHDAAGEEALKPPARTAPISPFMVDRRRPKFPVGDPLWRNGLAARFVFPVLGVVLAAAIG
jgi:hypothetical protein